MATGSRRPIRQRYGWVLVIVSVAGDCKGLSDDNGALIRGDRKINAAEAMVVRRIFKASASGQSPRQLAKTLNADAVPGPQGKVWTDPTIRGHTTRGTGILSNELYVV